MKEIHLEPWESISETVKGWLPLIEQRLYPVMPENPEVGKFYRLYPEGCISANHTPYHGSIRIGEEKENLLVFFNGGGVSWDEYMAAHPNGLFSAGQKDRFYFNECEWLGDGVLENGIASREEGKPFRNWSVINLPYSTGDFHCGTADFPYTALDGSQRILPHHGYTNTLAVLRMAKEYIGTPKKLLIAGTSAGGWGTSLMSEDVIRFFEGCEDVTCLVDSSTALKADWKRIAKEVWQAPEHIVSRIHSEDLMRDSYEALYKSFGGKVRCLFDCSIRDAALVSLQNYIDGQGMIYTREGGERLEKRLLELCRHMQETMPGSACFFFNEPSTDPAAGTEGLTQHGILEDASLHKIRTEGKTLLEWLVSAMNGEAETVGLSLFTR